MALNIGVIGCGAIGREHIKRIQKSMNGAGVIAVSEIDEVTGNKVADQWGVRFYKDGTDLIRDPQVQAVVIAAADPAHAGFVKTCIEEGKYVFCEKPLALEISDCRQIAEAEQKFGKRIVQVGFMRRYDPGYIRMKEVIKSGKIGRPLMAHACHRNLEHLSSMTSDMSIKNSGIHEIDVFRWLLEDEYESGQVVLPRQSNISEKEGLQDPQIMMLRTRQGICIDVEISQSSGYGYDIQCEVVGDLGTVKLPDPPEVITRTECSCSYAVMPQWTTRFTDAYNSEFQKWIDGVKADHITGPSAWDGYIACITAAVLGECRTEGARKKIEIPEKPKFYN